MVRIFEAMLLTECSNDQSQMAQGTQGYSWKWARCGNWPPWLWATWGEMLLTRRIHGPKCEQHRIVTIRSQTGDKSRKKGCGKHNATHPGTTSWPWTLQLKSRTDTEHQQSRRQRAATPPTPPMGTTPTGWTVRT